jgi:hypothetical protein
LSGVFLVDTNVHYPSQVPINYYQAPPQQHTYYPTDSQQPEIINYSQPWTQQPDVLNSSSQISTANSPYYPSSADQSSYIQPGFTSTPNPYPSQTPSWHPSGQPEPRDRLPSNEVCQILN